MIEPPIRYIKGLKLRVSTSDWRAHPDTPIGEQYLYGNGVVHHDIVNIPFYGQMYDTAVIAHPLSPSDCLFDPRIKVTHIQFVMCQLRDIQIQARNDHRTTLGELRARQDSIEVLSTVRRNAFERLSSRYFAQNLNEVPTGKPTTEDVDEESNPSPSSPDLPQRTACPEEGAIRADSKINLSIDTKLAEDDGTPESILRCTAYCPTAPKKGSFPRDRPPTASTNDANSSTRHADTTVGSKCSTECQSSNASSAS